MNPCNTASKLSVYSPRVTIHSKRPKLAHGSVSGTRRNRRLRSALAVQLEALQQSGCTKIFQEVASGTRADRQGLTATLDYLRPRDTLVVWRLDRLGRSLGQLIVLMNTLHQQQIGFQSLIEVIDTTTAMGQFFFQITGVFAELERNLIRERTLAELASARQWGQKRWPPQSHRSKDV